jgi:hypothetical protein
MKFETILTTALFLAVTEAAPGLKGSCRGAYSQGASADMADTQEAMVDTEPAIKTMATSSNTTLSRTSSLEQLGLMDLQELSAQREVLEQAMGGLLEEV